MGPSVDHLEEDTVDASGVDAVGVAAAMAGQRGGDPVGVTKTFSGDASSVKSAHEIYAYLDKHVIGQDHAKKALALAAHKHFKRGQLDATDGVQVQKSNLLLIGTTGSGKTLLAETMAKCLGLPFVSASANDYTAAGYRGGDIEDLAKLILEAANGNHQRARRAVVFLDEIDKIRAGAGESDVPDVNGGKVQQLLLTLLQGKVIGGLDTRNILFILGGSFAGIEPIIEARLQRQAESGARIGFGATVKDPDAAKATAGELIAQVTTDDLVAFGMIPELVGRIPVVTPLGTLGEADLVRVLTEPENALVKQFTAMHAIAGVTLRFTSAALQAVAAQAIARNTGARGLQSILEEELLELEFRLGDINAHRGTTVTVDAKDGALTFSEKRLLAA